MADHLRSSQQATLSALTIPIISQTSEVQEVLTEVVNKVMKLTGAEAASIRLVDDGDKNLASRCTRASLKPIFERYPLR
jgi:hypothetical protein